MGSQSTLDAPGGAPTARRVDQTTGVIEEAEFFGPSSQKLFGVRYTPPGAPAMGLVICASLHAELLVTYRSDVILARALAARGVAVQRFHYRGAGHSDGESSESTFDSMVEDAHAAVERLREQTGVESPAFLGTRWGALVAAAAAKRFEGAPLVLWEPTLEAPRFFQDALRAQKIHNLKEQTGDRPATDLIEEMRRDGFIDVLGYPIDWNLYQSAEGRTLDDELGVGARPILIAQVGRGKELRASNQRAVDRWTSRGCQVRVELVRKEEISWFLPSARHRNDDTQLLVELTTAWFDELLAEGSVR